jgi:2-methylcitrate dehydratase PrpD
VPADRPLPAADGPAETHVAAGLAGHVSRALDLIPPGDVIDLAKEHLLDTLAAMVSGMDLAAGRLALRHLAPQGGSPEAGVVGTGLRTTAGQAAFANAMAAHADETDDSHPPSITHPGCAVVPAALAMAERCGASGSDLLRAILAGYEIGPRIILALGVDQLMENGRSTHAIGGVFGAAAAAGALCRFSPDQARHLLACTVQQASGTRCWLDDPDHIQKAFDFAGMPARNGVAAAILVQAGLTGARDPFSGRTGFFQAFGPAAAPGLAIEGLGEEWEIRRTLIKKWSVGSPIQAALDALQNLMARHPIAAEGVARVQVFLNTRGAHVVNNRSMPDVCLQHLVALMLHDGKLDFAAIHDHDRMSDPAVLALRQRVDLSADPAFDAMQPRRPATVRLHQCGGAVLEAHVADVRGTPENPMTRDEICAKASDLLAPRLGAGQTARLVATVMEIETLADVRDLAPLLSGPAAA